MMMAWRPWTPKLQVMWQFTSNDFHKYIWLHLCMQYYYIYIIYVYLYNIHYIYTTYTYIIVIIVVSTVITISFHLCMYLFTYLFVHLFDFIHFIYSFVDDYWYCHVNYINSITVLIVAVITMIIIYYSIL
jgi:hypothetical protein